MPRRSIARFQIPSLSILGADGSLDTRLEPRLSEDRLLSLYRWMVLAREADQRLLKLQRQGRIGTFPLCTGQEAATCPVALAMGERDWLVPAFRELGALLIRGVGLEQVLALYAGYEEGTRLPASLRTLPMANPVASQIPHASGLAHAARLKGEMDTSVVCFFGDGATSEGDFHEALNFAAVWKAPVVFVCQNNGWAISLPTREQTASASIAQKAIAYGIPGVQVDGNDPLAVYRAADEALRRARKGEGPTLIEAVTYRLMMHTTSDDPTKYRDEAEVEEWWARDPIPRFRGYLEGKGIWDEDREAALRADIKTEIEGAVQRFESQLAVPPDAPFDHVLGTRHEVLDEQREAFLESRESDDG